MYTPHHFGYGFSIFGGYPFGGYIMMGIGLILIIALIYVLFRKKGQSFGNGKVESPLELLQKRYVNGEISREEYQEKKETLKR